MIYELTNYYQADNDPNENVRVSFFRRYNGMYLVEEKFEACPRGNVRRDCFLTDYEVYEGTDKDLVCVSGDTDYYDEHMDMLWNTFPELRMLVETNYKQGKENTAVFTEYLRDLFDGHWKMDEHEGDFYFGFGANTTVMNRNMDSKTVEMFRKKQKSHLGFVMF